VVVNHRSSTDPKGKVNTLPVSQEELDKLTALVKETMGFSTERGDSLKIISAPFLVDKTEPVELPFWKQPMLLDIIRAAAVPVALVAVALIAVFGMIRPAIRAANPPPPTVEEQQKLDAVVDETNLLPGEIRGPDGQIIHTGLPALEAPLANDKLERAKQLARDNPTAVANIMRSWMEDSA
jgi:flagellar M-ring protein FliF